MAADEPPEFGERNYNKMTIQAERFRFQKSNVGTITPVSRLYHDWRMDYIAVVEMESA